jgi:uncharacterized membrane protein
MKEKVSYINKSFKKAIIVLCLFAISLIAELLSIFFINEIIDTFTEIPIIIASLVGIVGLIQGIKGMREKKNAKVIFSVIINSIFVAILLFLMITIIIDISTIKS